MANSGRFHNTVVYFPDELGLNGLALTAERTSNTVECDGREQMTIYVDLSAWSAASTVSVAVDISENGTTWFPLQSESIAAGISTLTPLIWRQAVGAAEQWAIFSPIHAQKMRIRITSAGGAAGDIASVTLRLSNMGNG